MPAYGRLHKNVRCDVAVVGAGLTGALIANSLVREGFDVVLLDRRVVGHGSTSASTALVLYEIDTPLSELTQMIGRKSAVRAYHLCYEAIGQIAHFVEQLPEDCGFRKVRSLYLASNSSHIAKLKREFKVRKNAGFNLEYLPASDLWEQFNLLGPAALLTRDAAEIDPYRFTHRLVEGAVRRGLRVYDHSEMSQWTETSRNVTLETKSKRKVVAARVVMATGYESQLPLTKKWVRLKSTYALATAPTNINPLHRELCIWETARPYLYLRTTPDSRIIAGGADEDFRDPRRRDALIPAKTRLLRRKIEKLMPHIEIQPQYSWAGTFAETSDGLPFIGLERGHARIMHAYCYGANGTNFAMIATNLVTDWMRGRRNRDGAIFSLNR